MQVTTYSAANTAVTTYKMYCQGKAAGLVVGGLLGALAAQPSYAQPVQQYAPAPVGVVPGINTVPGCYYAAFVDVYGRQYFRQICN